MTDKDLKAEQRTQASLNDQVESPCIGVCVLDMADVCEGCFRTLDEIGRWSTLTPDGQREIIKLGWQRAKAAGKLL